MCMCGGGECACVHVSGGGGARVCMCGGGARVCVLT